MKVLSPGMEHGQKTDAGAEVFWVGANLEQGFGCGLEQEAVNHLLVLECQGGKRLGQGEYHMEVFNRQEVGGALFEPCRPVGAPTLWAMPIAAGAIGNRSMTTLIALIDVAAEGSGAAERNIPQ